MLRFFSLSSDTLNEECSVQLGKKKRVRGLTTLPHLTKNSNPIRRVVKYNEKGQPVGAMSTQLFSYMGVLARTMVPLSYEHWRKVPNALKERIWSCLEVSQYILFFENCSYIKKILV